MTHDSKYKKPTTLEQAAANPRYQGKIVIESPEGIYSTLNEERAVKELNRLQNKYPQQPPVSTVIPKGVLITSPYTAQKKVK
jgi:hypothetical protein